MTRRKLLGVGLGAWLTAQAVTGHTASPEIRTITRVAPTRATVLLEDGLTYDTLRGVSFEGRAEIVDVLADLVYAAVELAKKIFGELRGLRVLLLGAGEMAKLTGIHLQSQHVKQIAIASRTMASWIDTTGVCPP